MSDERERVVPPEEYVKSTISVLRETNYFNEFQITEDEMATLIWAKIRWKASVNDGFYFLDEEEFSEVFKQGVEIAVDNTIGTLVDKGCVAMSLDEKGEFAYEVTDKGTRAADHYQVLKIIQEHGKK